MSKNRVIISKILTHQLTVTEAAKQYGISRRQLHRLLARAREEGIDAVEPRSRKPLTNPRSTPDFIRERIITLRQHLRATGHDAGPITIAWHLERDGHQPPAVSTIRRILHSAGLITPEPRKRPKNSFIRFEADLPNETWQSDFTHWRLADGTDIEILNWLDDHSRYLITCRAFPRVTGDNVVTTFLDATEIHGTPASTLTDNGMVYTARFVGGKNAFEYVLTLLGVKQKNGSPGHPQTQGKIERFHQTLKRFLTQQPRAYTLAELQTQLDQFQDYYNEHRPHRACGRNTPGVTYRASAKALPALTPTSHTFRVRYDRVHPKGNLSLRRAGIMHHLGVGAKHAGRRVFMLIDDTEIQVIDIHTAELLALNLVQPERNYWRNQLIPPGRWPSTKKCDT